MSLLTVGAILGLAVLDMLSPALIGVALYLILARPPRTGRLLATYLATVALSYFALGVVLFLGLGAIFANVSEDVLAWVQAGVGATLFIGSWFIPTEPRRDPTASRRPLTARTMVLFGLGTWLFEFYTAVPFFGAIGLMLADDASLPQAVIVLAVYVLIMALPGIALYLAAKLLGNRMRGRFERWREKLASNSRSAISWIFGIVGVLLVFRALPVIIETFS